PKYSEFEAELIEWFREAQSQQKTVSQYIIQAKARTLYATSHYQEKYGEIQNNKFLQK
ncbi:790_t:CDS:1, partial [Cetraspora pellucida]